MLAIVALYFCAQENISTLNYASLAKRITNVATINEDPKTRLIRQLRAQVKFLNAQLAHSRQVYISDTNGMPVRRNINRNVFVAF